MRYEQIPAPAYLSNYVRYIWTLEIGVMNHQFRVIADGSPGLIFQNGAAGLFEQNNKEMPNVLLYGQATTHAEISIGKSRMIGICFFPNALKSVFGLNANELTDTCIDLDLFATEQGYYLREQLLNMGNVSEQINMLCAYIFAQIRKNDHKIDAQTDYVLSMMIRSKGTISLKALQKDLKVSERSLERKFKQHVGISPKMFSRICGFQASLSQLKNNEYEKLSDIAYENGYSDQSHFIRTFKEFAGFSPYQYQKQAPHVADNFPELIK
ncbi:AraC-type DNA-binding protein [Pedobacter steynii]|uniref:AraC-type DNA-binding protein n=1 Tax=Pedobacter steynii TaxID=430522 RepID=A0A1H0GFD1_9SPHI|nr:helix-turn-helix transcriptional regulator [Pedobacter steynii]NQX42408.1 helix-turn-helix transcriptional regulator [Pedobacter steynii]SDO05635.1 AraC-type DNA-binding protein [Pedobacter steynii]